MLGSIKSLESVVKKEKGEVTKSVLEVRDQDRFHTQVNWGRRKFELTLNTSPIRRG